MKILFDRHNSFLKSCRVQQWIRQFNIDARDQLAPSLLNSCSSYPIRGLSSRGSCLYPDNKGYSHFLLLNRRTVRRHRLIGTCAAPLRRVLRLGHAGTSKPTGQQDRENDSLYGPWQIKFQPRRLPEMDGLRFVTNHRSTKGCGFLFLFLFRSDNSRMKRLRDNSTYFFRGAFFVFSLFLSLLVRLGA